MITSADEIALYAMSINEQNYALALLELHIDFDMQVLLGIYGQRGSQRIDLVTYQPPDKQAIFIQGAYWHGGRNELEDQIKQSDAEQAGYTVYLVSEADSATVDAAKQHARRYIL